MLFCLGIGGLLISCSEDSSSSAADGAVPVIIMAEVLPMQSIGNDAATRVDLTAAEKEIKTAYVVQFNGTAPTSTAVWVSGDVSNQLKTNSPVNCNFTLPDSKSRVYVIANPKTTPTTGMSLSAFETVAYSVSASLPATGLPLAASQDVSASEAIHLFQLKCPLVRLTVTASKGTSILKGIPSAYSLAPATPGDNPVRLPGVINTATTSLASGTAYYVPANLAGRVPLAEPIYRCSLVAPADAMCVVVSANGTTYNFYLGDGTASDFNVVSNCVYVVTPKIYVSDGSDMRVGSPTNLALDKKGTSNCYIVPCGMPCSFNATVMGNGATTPAHTVGSISGDIASPAIIPTALAPTSAVVLWETVNTTSAPAKGSVIESVSLSGGRVSFRAGTAAGNAVIAVKNSSGVILWSWHIWSINQTPEEIGLNAIGSLTTNNELVIMDRNLGALSAAAGSDLSTGMHYQWGRKDPMPGAATLAGTAMATQPAGIPFIPDASAQYTVAQSIQQPSTFFNGGDWCTPRTDNLWGTPLTEKVIANPNTFNSNPGMKSIYDPCPVGWRVSPGYAFANATAANGGTWNSGYSFAIGNMSSYFPASGYRNSLNGTLSYVGSNGYYWTSAPNANSPTSGSSLGFLSGNVVPANGSVRGFGLSCRCAKE